MVRHSRATLFPEARAWHGRARSVGLLMVPLLLLAGCAGSTPGTTSGTASPSVTTAAAAPAAPVAAPQTTVIGDDSMTFIQFLGDHRMEEAANGTFQTFRRLIIAARLTDTFNGPGPVTVFAPTDEAFARAFTPAQIDTLTGSSVVVADLINFHVANGTWPLSKMADATIPTLQGNELRGRLAGGLLRVNGSVARTGATRVSNGYIYAINDVLLPPGFQIPGSA